ncbi:MAG TPA: hypothetical protein VLQ68_03720 [Rhizobiaceae bacterium]|nr:hypothetical protein [Rhizobiaceae bacterium]
MDEREDERQRRLLETPVGLPGSGRTRYAAAMYFWRTGAIDERLLEIYRICCKLDDEDPLAVARQEGIAGK